MTATPLLRPPARYLAVGVVCAIAHNVVMVAGDLAGLHYILLTLLAFVLVTPLGFFLHVRFTFAETATWTRFIRFASGVAAGFPLSLLTMVILISLLNLPMIVAAPIAIVVLFGWNYVAAHLAILGRLRRR